MLRRLTSTYLVLLALVLLALEVPLGVNAANGITTAALMDRLMDASRLASLADPALRDGDTTLLAASLDRYHELYGIEAAVSDRDGQLVSVAGRRSDFTSPAVQSRQQQALAGQRVGTGQRTWPWQSGPLVVAVPVISDGDVVGAVVLLSPTDQLHREQLSNWAAFAVAGLIALAVFLATAVGLARWVLRPVSQLDEATRQVSRGALQTPVPTGQGPRELRRLGHSFNRMAERVTDSLERQRAFVSQASHQLRNPLAALRLRVENLADHVDPAGTEEHRLTVEQTEQLAQILEGLLALARAEAGRPGQVEVDAGDAADRRIVAWQPLARQRGIRLLREGVASAMVSAAPTAVEQALDALIDNALKFSDPESAVVVDVRHRGHLVNIHVRDRGPGLSEDDRIRATERFWRAAGVQNIDGCGLGLPIVVALLDSSGGRLDLLPHHPRGLDARLSFRAAAQSLAVR